MAQKIKTKFLAILAILLSTGLFSACEQDDPDPENTAIVSMAGDWWVTYKVLNAKGVYVDTTGAGYTRLSTFNTAANTSGQMWVTDNGNFWTFMVKANVNLDGKNFSVNDAPSTSGDTISVNILDGKIIGNGGRTKGGHQVDSIAFMVRFSDDPDNFTYRVSGVKRTGFTEDEY